MSSLRLALKQSLHDAPASKKGKKSLYQHPDTLFKSDKELRRLQRLQEKHSANFDNDDDDNDSDDDDSDDDDNIIKKLRKKKKKRDEKIRNHRKGKSNKHGSKRGTEINATKLNDDNSLSGSSLSSSSDSSSGGSSSSSSSDDSSEDSSSDSDDDDDSSTTTSGSDSSNDDDDDDSEDDDDNKLHNNHKWKQGGKGHHQHRLKPSSSSSTTDDDSSSEDTIDIADRESKILFDADLSDNDNEDNIDNEEEGNEDDKRRQKRLLNKSKMLKRKKKKDDAANTIKNLWKKTSTGGTTTATSTSSGGIPEVIMGGVSNTNSSTTTTTARTVEPPTNDVLAHISTMSIMEQRTSVHPGLRVKVRFVKKSRNGPHGHISRKLKWYGGIISGMTNDGTKIKVHYDDGTSEISNFPDKDIVIDDTNNRKHAFGVGGKNTVIGNSAGSSSSAGVDGSNNCDSSSKGGGTVVIAGAAFAPPPSLDDKKQLCEGEGEGGTIDVEVAKGEQRGAEDEVDDHETEEERTSMAIARQLKKAEKKEKKLKRKRMLEEEEQIAINNTTSNERMDEKGDEGGLGENGSYGMNNSRVTKTSTNMPPIMPKIDDDEDGRLDIDMEDGNDGDIQFRGILPSASSSSIKGSKNDQLAVTNSHDANVKITSALAIDDDLSPGSTETKMMISSNTTATAAVDNVDVSMVGKKVDDVLNTLERPRPGRPRKYDAEGLPPGWTTRLIQHKGPDQRHDPYWFSPNESYKFNSMANVKRFIACLETVDGDEVMAYELTKKGKKWPMKSKREEEMDEEDEEMEKKSEENDMASDIRQPLSPPITDDQDHQHQGPSTPGTKKLRIRIGLPGAKRKKLIGETRVGDASSTADVDSSTSSRNIPESSAFEVEHGNKKQRVTVHNDKDEEQQVVDGNNFINSDQVMKDPESSIHLNLPTKPTLDTNIESQKREGRMAETSVPPGDGVEAASADNVGITTNITDHQNKTSNYETIEPLKPPATMLPHVKRIEDATDATASVADDLDPTTTVSSRSDEDKSNKLNKHLSAGSESGNIVDEDHASYSMARSGRKAAKIAAERISEKKYKPKKEEKKNKKDEEDPWVQCERCEKWRHLPNTVNVDNLPDHWFCELNIYDTKRNSCEAEEQTPKEVAKEKKRAKKLALKKMEYEEAKKAAELVNLESKSKSKSGRTSTSPHSEMPNERAASMGSIGSSGKPITVEGVDEKPKPKRGRPRNEDRIKKSKDVDAPKQEWVQCEKCEKWRRVPPRISASDLPDVWYCSMNTWDINLASCTAVEDKHEASPARTAQFNEQSQIPSSFATGNKLTYRNLIFGSGRSQKNISERMRAQASLFSMHEQDDADLSLPPTCAYSNSSMFYNKSLHKNTSDDEEQTQRPMSVFDIVSHSRAWKELNNNASLIHAQSEAAYNSVGYEKYCQPDGSLNEEAVNTLKAMAYVCLGTNTMVGHKLLLDIQCQEWNNVPPDWLELRSLCTIEMLSFIMDELIKDGLVEMIHESSYLHLDTAFYRRLSTADAVAEN